MEEQNVEVTEKVKAQIKDLILTIDGSNVSTIMHLFKDALHKDDYDEICMDIISVIMVLHQKGDLELEKALNIIENITIFAEYNRSAKESE